MSKQRIYPHYEISDVILLHKRAWEIIAIRAPVYGDIYITSHGNIRFVGWETKNDNHPPCYIVHPKRPINLDIDPAIDLPA